MSVGNPAFDNVKTIQDHGATAILVENDPNNPMTFHVALSTKGRQPNFVVLREGFPTSIDAERYAARIRSAMSDFSLFVANIAKGLCSEAANAVPDPSPGNNYAKSIMQAINSAF